MNDHTSLFSPCPVIALLSEPGQTCMMKIKTELEHITGQFVAYGITGLVNYLCPEVSRR